jgi:hypothetical protein
MKWMQCALCGWRSYALCGGWMSTRICRLWPSRPSSYSFCMTSAAWHSGRSGSFLSVWDAGTPSITAIHGSLFPGVENPTLSMARVMNMAMVLLLTASRLFLLLMLGRPCTPRCLLVLAGSRWVSASTIGSLVTRQRRWGPMFLAGKLAYRGYLYAITSGRLVNVLDQISTCIFWLTQGRVIASFLISLLLFLLAHCASLVLLAAPYHALVGKGACSLILRW